MAGLRKPLSEIRPYRDDPLSISHADFEFGTGEIEMNTSIFCSKDVDVVEFVRENFTEIAKKRVDEAIKGRENIKRIHTNFEIEGEQGEELGWQL